MSLENPQVNLEKPPEEETVCRICRSNEQPLYHPCKCSGSIKFVHQDCLLKWIGHSQKKKCEVCDFEFNFTSELAKDAPQTLSFFQLLKGLLSIGKNTSQKLLRAVFSTFIWVAFLPSIAGKFYSFITQNSFWNIIYVFTLPTLEEYITGGIIYLCLLIGILLFIIFNDFVNEHRDLFDENQIQAPEEPIEPVEPIPNIPDINNENLDEVLPNLENNEVHDHGLEEILGLKGDIFAFIQNILMVSFIIWVCEIIFILVPFLQGKLFYFLFYGTYEPQPTFYDFHGLNIPLTNGKIIFLGYIQSILFLYLSASLISLIFENDVSKIILTWMKKIYLFCKIGVFFAIHFILIPIFCGFVLNYASLEFFGKSEEILIQTLKEDLLSILFIFLLVGVIFLIQLSFTIKIFRQFLRPQVFWFLNNPEDPNFSFVREIVNNNLLTQFRRLCSSLMMFSMLILLFVRIPLKFSKYLFSYLFPLKVTFGDPLFHSSLDIVLFYIFTNLLQVEGVRPGNVLRSFYQFLFDKIGGLLDLKDYLFVSQQERKPNMFLIRISYLLALTAIVGIGMMTLVLSLPLILGHWILSLVGIETPNHLWVHILGSYSITGVIFAVRLIIDHVLNTRFYDLIMKIVKIIEVSSLIFFSVTIVPLLCGSSFILTFIYPFLTLKQTISMKYYEIWSLGVFTLGTLTKILLFLPLEEFEFIKEEFRRINQDGFNIDTRRIVQNLIFPYIYNLTLYMLLPYNVTFGILSFLTDLSYYELNLIQKFTYPMLFILLLTEKIVSKIINWYKRLQNVIIEEQYLVERRLINHQ